MRYLDPKNDLTFKKVFAHKDLLKSFLNALLPLEDDQLIEDLELLPPEQTPVNPGLKNSTVDVKCKDKAGRQFIVEMQLTWNKNFKPRALFNTAKAFVRQIGKGKTYITLKPVYTLCLIDDTFHSDTEEFYHHYTMTNVKNSQDCLEGMTLVYVELPKFHPRSFLEKKMAVLWLRFLTEIKDLDNQKQNIPEDLLKNKYTNKALEIVEESSFTESELAVYEKYWDVISVEKGFLSDASEKGIEKGIEKKEIEAVLGFHKNGISIDIISKSLNISKERVQEIIEQGIKK